jgi:transcription initiation factor TFIID subunit 8
MMILGLDMLQFLKTVHSSMTGSRRSAPTPQDFALALAHGGLSSSALLPFLETPPEPSVCQPQIPPMPASEPIPPNLGSVLGPELSSSPERQKQNYVPKHLPVLPSRHTWQATPVYPKREEDMRKIRERATQEGVMAEQALRRLMAASKSGADGKEVQRRLNRAGSKSKAVWDAAWAAIQQADNDEMEKEEQADWEGEDTEMAPPVGATKVKAPPNAVFDTAMIVNYDRKYWRQAARGRT